MTITIETGFAGSASSKRPTKNQGVELSQFAEIEGNTETLPDYLRINCETNGLDVKRAMALYCGISGRKSVFDLSSSEFKRFVRQRRNYTSANIEAWKARAETLKQEVLDNLQNETMTRGKYLLSTIVRKQSYKLFNDRNKKGKAIEPKNAKPYRKAFPKLLRGSQSHANQSPNRDYFEALDALQETYMFFVRSCGKQAFSADQTEDDKLIILAEKGIVSHRTLALGRFQIMKQSQSYSKRVNSRVDYRDRLGETNKRTELKDILLGHLDSVISAHKNGMKPDAYVIYCKILKLSFEGFTYAEIVKKLDISLSLVKHASKKFMAIIQARIGLFEELFQVKQADAIAKGNQWHDNRSQLVITVKSGETVRQWDNNGINGRIDGHIETAYKVSPVTWSDNPNWTFQGSKWIECSLGQLVKPHAATESVSGEKQTQIGYRTSPMGIIGEMTVSYRHGVHANNGEYVQRSKGNPIAQGNPLKPAGHRETLGNRWTRVLTDLDYGYGEDGPM